MDKATRFALRPTTVDEEDDSDTCIPPTKMDEESTCDLIPQAFEFHMLSPTNVDTVGTDLREASLEQDDAGSGWIPHRTNLDTLHTVPETEVDEAFVISATPEATQPAAPISPGGEIHHQWPCLFCIFE
eukprot:5703529-Pyramimonas_sp.AAC.2